MPETGFLPRLVIRGDIGLSWNGPVPWTETLEAVDHALQDFGRVLVWDLDGIERNRPNLGLLRHFEGESLWVDPGIRFGEAVIDVLIAGAERVVLGTKTLRNLVEVEAAWELTENLVPMLDFAHGKLWAPESVLAVPSTELFRSWRERGTDTVLLLDEKGEVPEPFLRGAPDGLTLFAGLMSRKDSGSLPAGTGAIIDIWEAVPRKT